MIRKYHGIESRNSPWVKNAVSGGEKFWTATMIPGSNSIPMTIEHEYTRLPDEGSPF
jgi:hypothetical protein